MGKDLVTLLQDELVPAMGCTEPIAIAYGASVARKVLGCFPEKITANCSGNIIKNVKGVVVPGTKNMRGIETSAILGALAGNPELRLEVLSRVTAEDVEKTRKYFSEGLCRVNLVEGVENLYIDIRMSSGGNTVQVVISDAHTNIIKVERNGETLFSKECEDKPEDETLGDYSLEDLYEFARTTELKALKPVLDRQIDYNLAIAEEGMKGSYGAGVGKTILQLEDAGSEAPLRAYAAAASDARMSGCELPVVINSGSGNQGITVSVPVIKYANQEGITGEKLYRALVFSNLVAIYIKKGIGKLSAYCGVVGAACGAGAGIGFLSDDEYPVIEKTIINTLGNVSGIVCDGAKSSCAAKIATAVDAALLGRKMAEKGSCFQAGEGLTGESADDTIKNIWCLGKEGMKQTDIEILKMMIGSEKV